MLIKSKLLLILTLVVSGQCVLAQNTKNYQAVCYCASDDYSPQHILSLENNMEVVINLIKPQSLEQLNSVGIKAKADQINLLRKWSLIEEVGNGRQLKTTFPVLTREQTLDLRSKSYQYAKAISPLLLNSIRDLKYTLQQKGFSGYSFSILYAYVFDMRVWQILADMNIIRKHVLDSNRPHWNGEFWLLDDPRGSSYEASTISHENTSLIVNWNNVSEKSVQPIISNWETVYHMLSEVASGGKISDPGIYKDFGHYNIFDQKGILLVPVIDEKKGDKLKSITDLIAKKIVTELLRLPLDQLVNDFSFRDKEQALIILYHELILDITDQLIKENIIEQPMAFGGLSQDNAEDFSGLLFVVKH